MPSELKLQGALVFGAGGSLTSSHRGFLLGSRLHTSLAAVAAPSAFILRHPQRSCFSPYLDSALRQKPCEEEESLTNSMKQRGR